MFLKKNRDHTMKKNILVFIFLISMSTLSFAQRAPNNGGLISVASFGKSMVIGLSVTPDNRIFVAFPGYNGDGHLALAEVKKSKIFPYPDLAWNNQKATGDDHFLHVQDLFADDRGNLWVLDSKPGKPGLFKLVKIDTKTGHVERVYRFEDLDKSKSALNDMRIDGDRNIAYLTDPGQAAIVVLVLTTGKTKTCLKNSPFTKADPLVLNYDGRPMIGANGKPFFSNVNGIALTRDFRYLYFKPINKEHLYRIDTRFLLDTTLSEKELENKVEDMGKVGVTHGLIADKAGNVYLTTSEKYSISYLSPDGKLHTLVHDSRLLWPDSMGIGPDGYLYVSCAQMQRLPNFNEGIDKTAYPYRIYKVKLPIH